ncbi:MAG: MBL fold metallo-hydrolase, partial [Dethiobacteria bacterium]
MAQRIEEILPAIFKIEVPLRGNPLKSINSYLIRGNGRDLIIDTGMNTKECLAELLSALHLLDVDLKKADLFITHLHVDHMGLVYCLAQDSSEVYFNGPDLEMMKNVDFWEQAFTFVSRHGFPEDELREAIDRHPAHKFRLQDETIFTLLGE